VARSAPPGQPAAPDGAALLRGLPALPVPAGGEATSTIGGGGPGTSAAMLALLALALAFVWYSLQRQALLRPHGFAHRVLAPPG
jgi:hypothetical protein